MARTPIDDLTKQKIRKEFLTSPPKEKLKNSWTRIAERFGVSVSSVRRITDGLSREEVQATAAAVVHQSGTRIDFDQALLDALARLKTEAQTVPVKSAEGAARTMIELMREYDRRNPETVEQLVEYVLNHPAFTVQGFIKALRDRVDQMA